MGKSFKFQINKMKESFLFDYDANHNHNQEIGENLVSSEKTS